MISQDPTAALAQFAATLRVEDIPAPVLRRAEDLFLDWFGSTGEIEVTNLDVAAGFLQGLPPELFAASRPKVGSGVTAEQMQERVKGKLKEFGMPGFVAGFFTRRIPMLERWKSKAAS